MSMTGEVAVASSLVRSTLDRAVRIGALARDTVLCSWARHLTLTVPLSRQGGGGGELWEFLSGDVRLGPWNP